MSPQTDNDTPIDLLSADSYAQYLLRGPKDVAYVLRQLLSRRAMITAFVGEANDFLPTLVVGVAADNSHVMLDFGPDAALVARAIAEGRIQCVTQLDRVKIQFALEGLERTTFEGHPALRANLPVSLLRLQRREYFRLSLPGADTPNCLIPLEDGRRIQARVLDISGNGIAIIAPPEGTELEVGKRFANCRLELPDTTPVIVSLQIRNIFHTKTRNGQEMLRAGCLLVDLPTNAETQIQRFILKAERERNHYRG